MLLSPKFSLYTVKNELEIFQKQKWSLSLSIYIFNGCCGQSNNIYIVKLKYFSSKI